METYFIISIGIIALNYLLPISETHLKPVASVIRGVLWPLTLLYFLWNTMLTFVIIATAVNCTEKGDVYIDTTEIRLLT